MEREIKHRDSPSAHLPASLQCENMIPSTLILHPLLVHLCSLAVLHCGELESITAETSTLMEHPGRRLFPCPSLCSTSSELSAHSRPFLLPSPCFKMSQLTSAVEARPQRTAKSCGEYRLEKLSIAALNPTQRERRINIIWKRQREVEKNWLRYTDATVVRMAGLCYLFSRRLANTERANGT